MRRSLGVLWQNVFPTRRIYYIHTALWSFNIPNEFQIVTSVRHEQDGNSVFFDVSFMRMQTRSGKSMNQGGELWLSDCLSMDRYLKHTRKERIDVSLLACLSAKVSVLNRWSRNCITAIGNYMHIKGAIFPVKTVLKRNKTLHPSTLTHTKIKSLVAACVEFQFCNERCS